MFCLHKKRGGPSITPAFGDSGIPLKNNIGDDESGRAFTIQSATLTGGIETSRVIWETEAVAITADEAMAPHEDPIGFVLGSFLSDLCVRRFFAGSQKRMLIVGQTLLALMMSAFLGWGDRLPLPLLAATFFLLGIVVSSGVLIYPIIRASFPVSIVGTAMTSLNFFVLLGAATTQQLMGIIIGAQTPHGSIPTPAVYHSAFLLPIIGLLIAIVLYTFAHDTSKTS